MSDTTALVTTIIYFGQPHVVACDGRCDKAWGISSRPRKLMSEDDPEDVAYLADGELGEAPADPGTYEGADGKPANWPPDYHNRWCVRECERSEMSNLWEFGGPIKSATITVRDFSERRYNKPQKVAP